MKKKILTIITVTKNCQKTIMETLNSIELVKSDLIEYIIVDGRSTDNTLKKIKSKKGLVDILISEADTGIYNAMNKGINLASGEYIVFLNGDDLFYAKHFYILIKLLRTKKHDIVCAYTQILTNSNKFQIIKPEPWKLLFFNSIPHPSSFIRKSILKNFKFDENYIIASDYKLFLTLYLKRFKFTKVDKVLAFHRRGGISSNVGLSLEEIKKIRKECLGLLFNYINFIQYSYNKVAYYYKKIFLLK